MKLTPRGAWSPLLFDPVGERSGLRADSADGLDLKRSGGKTMVIDKGVGWHAYCDMIDAAGAYIDIIKLAFGTSVLYPTDLLLRKIGYARRNGITVIPGGTLLETAVRHDAASAFFDAVCALGFDGIEVSEGTIELGRRERTALIREGRARGLTVFAEFGKKEAGSAINPFALADAAEADWDAGASLVTIEARESGTVGMFDGDGRPDPAVFEQIIKLITDTDRLMWEAPRKEQQVFLIRAAGPNVHLGNIAPGDVLTLEAMRRGLRNDTFMMHREPAALEYMI
ncbi:MAG: phosphosulfolactate synthase [Thermobacillus sp.]|uniref:phosphosulfolactate synthase n=1 Tax=Thermobacillus sp. TaxID=2108467 RepID=UPI000E370C49|nr:phosphosulfolactate synthase [Thermobacillus sp.]REK57500.1 MAG: phosphosulfolactate synthase [Thermobacillus sp.]